MKSKVTAMRLVALAILVVATGCSSSDDKCGNGNIDDGEQCDGVNLNAQTCVGLEFSSGDLACTENCRFDTTACESEECGNNLIEGNEECDGENFGKRTCQSLSFETGTLDCSDQCKLVTSGCSGGDPCGNGFIDADEECDKNNVGDATCESLGHTGGGVLRCENELCLFDTDGCHETPCVDDDLEPNDTANLATPTSPDYSRQDLVICDEERNDWFKFELQPRHLYEIKTDFLAAQGDINLFLYWETNTDYLWAKAISNTDDELIRYAFAEGEARTFLLEVSMYIDEDDESWPKGPATYDLVISDKGTPDCVMDADCNDATKVCLDYACQTMLPGDSCANAIVVDALPFTATDVDISGYTPKFQYESQTNCALYGSGGKDVIYKIDLTAGQSLTATAQGSEGYDVLVHLANSCTASPVSTDACEVGADEAFKGEAETITFTATQDGTYYVLVDHWDHLGPTEGGTFDLSLSLSR